MDYIEGFCKDCLARGLTKHTVETYAGQVKAFLRAYSEPAGIKIKDLIDFLGVLRISLALGHKLRRQDKKRISRSDPCRPGRCAQAAYTQRTA